MNRSIRLVKREERLLRDGEKARMIEQMPRKSSSGVADTILSWMEEYRRRRSDPRLAFEALFEAAIPHDVRV